MAKYLLRLTIASGYIHGQGWQYEKPPMEEINFDWALDCDEEFERKKHDLNVLASTNAAAARLQTIRKDDRYSNVTEIIREQVYDGENVYFWFAAYQQKGQTIFEDKYYISRVFKEVGYYAFIHPGNQYPKIKVVACCQSLYDLRELLGEEAGLYENRT